MPHRLVLPRPMSSPAPPHSIICRNLGGQIPEVTEYEVEDWYCPFDTLVVYSPILSPWGTVTR